MHDISLMATIYAGETLQMVWESLGVFRYLFLFALVVIVLFFVRGWRMLSRHECPLDFDRGIDDEQREHLDRLASQGMGADNVRELFGQQGADTNNLFFNYLARFGARNPQRSPPPSLMQATEEMFQINRIQTLSSTIRFLSAMLPAIGLLGTLIGMFNAFFGTDFSAGGELTVTMQELMRNFALALFTTMTAVLLKIAVDLFNHFTLDIYINRLRAELSRLRSLLMDCAYDGVPAPGAAAKTKRDASEGAEAGEEQPAETDPAESADETGEPTP